MEALLAEGRNKQCLLKYYSLQENDSLSVLLTIE